MFYAINSNGNRVNINDASTVEEYFCPLCKSKLVIKNGSVYAKHFAHNSHECFDNWNYDMSEWHQHKQSFFESEFCEVVVKHNGETHRADVLIDNTVIEFQHSSITADEFEKRTIFFINAGYRIAWVFDVTKQYISKSIDYLNEDNDFLFRWKKPMEIFSKCPNISDDSKNFALWITWDCGEDKDFLYKIIWTLNNNGRYNLKHFAISPYFIDMNNHVKPDDFFKSQKKYLKEAIDKLKTKHSYHIKYSGENGRKKDDYICPCRNEFGIKIFSQKGCAYCKYCYMIAEKQREDITKWAVYCCYPKQVRELINIDPEYECDRAPFYPI